jgi:hypothetical protein
MKTSASILGFALALLACIAYAASQPTAEVPDPTALLASLESAGADSEFSVLSLPGINLQNIIAVDKVSLRTLPAAEGTPNANSRSIFSWVATERYISWKLSLFDIEGFTGAHLHLNTPAGPIVQHLVPEISVGDFIPPTDVRGNRVYTGYFGTSELEKTLGVSSIRQFISDYVSDNEIYVNVHGPTKAAILQGYLNA